MCSRWNDREQNERLVSTLPPATIGYGLWCEGQQWHGAVIVIAVVAVLVFVLRVCHCVDRDLGTARNVLETVALWCLEKGIRNMKNPFNRTKRHRLTQTKIQTRGQPGTRTEQQMADVHLYRCVTTKMQRFWSRTNSWQSARSRINHMEPATTATSTETTNNRLPLNNQNRPTIVGCSLRSSLCRYRGSFTHA